MRITMNRKIIILLLCLLFPFKLLYADFKVLSPEEYVGLIAQETLDVLEDKNFCINSKRLDIISCEILL